MFRSSIFSSFELKGDTMSIPTVTPAYILGNAPTAEHRLELLNELTTTPFINAMAILPKTHMRICILGCGSGHLEARLAALFSNSHFIGIDISQTRLNEANLRVTKLTTSNTYEYILGDITTMSPASIQPCDILISRFVLSHLPDAETHFTRFVSIVKPGGYICTEEGASDGKEYFCNTQNSGYTTFVSLIDMQISHQASKFNIGFSLLSQTPGKLLHCHIMQPILQTARHKSILRLGLEEAKATVLKDQNVDELIASLLDFEQDDKAFGLYMRSLAMIVQKDHR